MTAVEWKKIPKSRSLIHVTPKGTYILDHGETGDGYDWTLDLTYFPVGEEPIKLHAIPKRQSPMWTGGFKDWLAKTLKETDQLVLDHINK